MNLFDTIDLKGQKIVKEEVCIGVIDANSISCTGKSWGR